MKWITLLIMVAIIGLIAIGGCTTPYSKARITPSDAQFVGIFEQDQANPIDVISIHGMCTHDREWVEDSVAEMSAGLRMTSAGIVGPETVSGVEIWTTALSDDAGRQLTNYAIVWSPLTTPYKRTLCYDNDKSTKVCTDPNYPWKRARINGAAKSTLLNDCFSDAIIYSGDAGPDIRTAIRATLDKINEQRTAKKDSPLFLISSSLGSKVLADAVVEDIGTETGRNRIDDLSTLKQIYMAANQIPLLDLADSAESRSGGLSSLEILRRAIETTESRGGIGEDRVQIIAFTDPNDLFSYGLPDDEDTANVILSNAPTIFGLFSSPWRVHTGYLSNPEFWRIVMCGSKTKDQCDQR